jgi:uncharacterized membrane protein YdjX (TVP38/TMEM64 family)
VRGTDFVLGTAIGIAPGVALLVLFGERLGPWLAERSLGPIVMLLALGLVALSLHRRED